MRSLVLGLALGCAACARSSAPAPALTTARAMPGDPSARDPTEGVRVLVGGDVMPHRPMLIDADRVASALTPLRPLFDSVDSVVVNYETATGDERDLLETARHIALAAKPDWMHALAASRVTAVTVANNHACDLGLDGVDATLRAAEANDVVAIGADRRDPWRARVLGEEDGHRVCAVAWTTFVNGPVAGCDDSGQVAVASFRKRGLARIDHAIERARTVDECDAVIAIIHGGNEYEPQIPLPLLQARRAALAGADAVVLHHPHVPSPVTTIQTPDGRTVPIFESVGNLVSNQGESWRLPYTPHRPGPHSIAMNAWTRLGVLADLRWRWAPGAPVGTRGALDWGYHLLWIENEHAYDHDKKLPRIDARVMDAVTDAPLVDQLRRDPSGPLPLFDDPRWLEGGQARPDEVGLRVASSRNTSQAR